jgi:hypothetical protein
MPYVTDRQGQKLHRFVRIGLDYFSREKEWSDFVQLVRQPTENSITWHDDAVSEVFNFSNGNPYFAKMICGEVFSTAVQSRDADITADDVSKAALRRTPELGTNSFAHLWQDGVNAAGPDKEPEIDRRRRFLVTIARTLHRGQVLNLENIVQTKNPELVGRQEVISVLSDFVRRNILREDQAHYEFVLPIFKLWLTDSGMSALASDAVGEQLARSAEASEELAHVKASEIEALTRAWPTYQGKPVSSEAVRAWLDQLPRNRQRRLLFTILQNVTFFDEQSIRQSLRTAHGILRPSLPEFVQKKRSQRRMDVIITYIDGEGKSGYYYATKYADGNRISTQSIISPVQFVERLEEYRLKHGNVAALVIVDDIVATGRSLAGNLKAFASDNGAFLKRNNIPVTALVLTATIEGEAVVRKELDSLLDFDADLRVCEALAPRHFAFAPESGIWKSLEDLEEAKALCIDLGTRIYGDNPLGYGQQALLLVFPDTCPNNSLPILHTSRSGPGGFIWNALFPRLAN